MFARIGCFMASSSGSSDEEYGLAEGPAEPQRRPRIFRPRINFANEQAEAKQRFRLKPKQLEQIMRVIGPFLQHSTERSMALLPEQ